MRAAKIMIPLALVVLHALERATFAQTDAKTEAAAHFDRGLALAEQGSYQEAIPEFNRAYELSPHFAVLYNLGQTYVALQESVYAVQALRRYLSEGAAQVPASRRTQVEATIAREERNIATVTFHSNIGGAVIVIDGVEVGRSPMTEGVQVKAGPRVVSASAPGYRPSEQVLSLTGRERRVVEVRLEAEAAPAIAMAPAGGAAATAPTQPSALDLAARSDGSSASAAEPRASSSNGPTTTTPSSPPPPSIVATPGSPAAAPVPSGAKHWRRPVAYAVGGLGAGALVVGGVFGLRAFSKRHDSDAQCPLGQCSSEGVALNEQAKTAALVSNVTVGAGVVSLVAAAYLFVTAGNESVPPSSAVAGLRIIPQIASSEASVALGGAW